MEITHDMITALATLRDELRYRECTNDRVAKAIAVMDDAGVFAPIDDLTPFPWE